MTAAAHWRMALLACVVLVLAALWGCGRKSEEADTGPPPVVADLPAADESVPPTTEAAEPEAPQPAEASVSQDTEEPPGPPPAPEEPKPAQPAEKPTPPAPRPTEAKPTPAPPAPKESDREEPPIKKQPPAVPQVPPEAKAQKPKGTTVVGKITLVSNVPDPSTVTYKDCVTFIKYQVENVESGDYQGDELIAVFWGMRDSKLQPPARFSTGQRHRLAIQPLSARPELERMMRADDTNDYSLTPYWVVTYSGK